MSRPDSRPTLKICNVEDMSLAEAKAANVLIGGSPKKVFVQWTKGNMKTGKTVFHDVKIISMGDTLGNNSLEEGYYLVPCDKLCDAAGGDKCVKSKFDVPCLCQFDYIRRHGR